MLSENQRFRRFSIWLSAAIVMIRVIIPDYDDNFEEFLLHVANVLILVKNNFNLTPSYFPFLFIISISSFIHEMKIIKAIIFTY